MLSTCKLDPYNRLRPSRVTDRIRWFDNSQPPVPILMLFSQRFIWIACFKDRLWVWPVAHINVKTCWTLHLSPFLIVIWQDSMQGLRVFWTFFIIPRAWTKFLCIYFRAGRRIWMSFPTISSQAPPPPKCWRWERSSLSGAYAEGIDDLGVWDALEGRFLAGGCDAVWAEKNLNDCFWKAMWHKRNEKV